MERKLLDALAAQIVAGIILPEEMCELQRKQYSSFVPRCDDMKNLREDLVTGIFQFQRLSAKLGLPTHNAVAFFTAAFEREPALMSKEKTRAEFKALLHLAISGRGFVFGTAFDQEQAPGLRPCDLPQAGFAKEQISPLAYESLKHHASLKTAYYFCEDYAMCQSTLKALEEQSALVAEWQKAGQDTFAKTSSTFNPTIRDLLEFWDIYSRYCLMQLENKDDPNMVVATLETSKQVREDLRNIKQVMMLLIHLDCFYTKLNDLLRSAKEEKPLKKEEHLERKKIWINRFMRFLKRRGTADALEIAGQSADKTGETKSRPSLGLGDFIKAVDYKVDTGDMKKLYPILDLQKVSRNLKADEKRALSAYREHPMYQCFQKVKKALSNAQTAAIAPYYLTQWFIHKHNPQKPFWKSGCSAAKADAAINAKITVESDERVHYYQKCHHDLFCELCNWWSELKARHPEMVPHNQALCEALYTRCRHQVVKQDWLRTESRPFSTRRTFEEPIYQLYQQLDGIFDYTRFPLYAKTMCREEDMLYFFYEKQDCDIVKVKRKIRKLLETKNIDLQKEDWVTEYKGKVFLSDDGLGKSVMPLKWHEELAQLLERIIRSDHVLQSYVTGDPDPYYPGSAMNLSEINAGIAFKKDKDKIYPEDLQPYLAVVEWYIQKVFCDQIRADLQPKVLALCKRVFLTP